MASGRTRCVLRALLGLLFAASLPARAGADEASWDSSGSLESVIVTATRVERSALDVAAAVSMIDDDAIRRQAPELLAGILRGMPGAFFQQTTPGQGIPIIRGLKGSQVLHLVDGMRLNNAFFRDAPNQYLGLVDAYAAERIEVVRGSAPSVHGADAMGGVVQVLTREPEVGGSAWAGQGRLYAAWSSADHSLTGRAEAATGRAGTVLSGGITYQDHGNRETGGGTTVRPSGYRLNAADFKWRQDFGERSELMVSLQYLEQPSTPRVDELVPGFGQDRPASAQYEFMPNRREFLHARYTLDGDARWFSRLQAHLARQTISDDRLTRDFGAAGVTREFNSSRLDGLTLQFDSPWGAGGGSDRELVWGIEFYADEIDSSRLRSASAVPPWQPVTARFPDGSSMDSAALYASNHWSWERLAIDAGLRYSRFEIFLPATAEVAGVRLTPTDLTGEVTPGGRSVVRSDNLSQARLYGLESGLRWLVRPDLELYGVINFTRGEESQEDGPAAPADRIPPLNGRLGLVWRPRERLRFEPYVDFAGAQNRLSQRDRDDPRIDPAGSPGWATLNLLASWQATDAASFGLKLQNLADRNYREHGSGIDAPGRDLGAWINVAF